MLRRKSVVQKSIRLDSQLAYDIEILSKILNRPQNDLINTAIESLILENKRWFIENMIVDGCMEYILIGDGVVFEGAGVRVEITINEDNLSTTVFFQKFDKNGNILDENTKNYSDDLNTVDDITDYLRSLSVHLDRTSKDVEDYLDHRLDYK